MTIDIEKLDAMIKWHDAHEFRKRGPVSIVLEAAKAYLDQQRQPVDDTRKADLELRLLENIAEKIEDGRINYDHAKYVRQSIETIRAALQAPASDNGGWCFDMDKAKGKGEVLCCFGYGYDGPPPAVMVYRHKFDMWTIAGLPNDLMDEPIAWQPLPPAPETKGE